MTKRSNFQHFPKAFENMTFQTLANVIIAEDRGDKKYSYLDLVRSSNMRKLALLTGITWWECFV